jgi:hypothetical protein
MEADHVFSNPLGLAVEIHGFGVENAPAAPIEIDVVDDPVMAAWGRLARLIDAGRSGFERGDRPLAHRGRVPLQHQPERCIGIWGLVVQGDRRHEDRLPRGVLFVQDSERIDDRPLGDRRTGEADPDRVVALVDLVPIVGHDPNGKVIE